MSTRFSIDSLFALTFAAGAFCVCLVSYNEFCCDLRPVVAPVCVVVVAMKMSEPKHRTSLLFACLAGCILGQLSWFYLGLHSVFGLPKFYEEYPLPLYDRLMLDCGLKEAVGMAVFACLFKALGRRTVVKPDLPS